MGVERYPYVTLETMASIHDTDREPITKSDRTSGRFPYYGASGIADYIDDYRFSGEFVLLAEDGDNLRTSNTPIAFLATGKFWVNNHAHVLKGQEGNNTKFICYALQFADVTSYISGSTRPKITQRDMRRIMLPCPSQEDQDAIVRVLGSLDDKIELNRQTNETLEAMAQAMFKSWFVDFDPVIDNALAAGNDIPEPFQARAAARQALGDARKPLPEEIRCEFPDEFVFSDEMGWVPCGWSVNSIKSLTDKLSKGTTPTKSSLEDATDLSLVKFVKVRDLDDNGQIKMTALGLIPESIHEGNLKRSRIYSGDILFSIAGTIGRVAIVPNPLNNSNINQALAFIRLIDSRFTNYIYLHLKSDLVQKTVSGRVVHAVQANFSLTELGGLAVVTPSVSILDSWFRMTYELFAKQDLVREQNAELKTLRDTLLPKLLSGQLTIPNVEKLVTEAL